MKLAKLSALASMLLLMACQFTSIEAGATCTEVTQQSISTFVSGSTPAALEVAPASGCTLVIDAISATLYGGTMDHTVSLVGISGVSCTTGAVLLDSFPVIHGTASVNRNFDTPQNGGLDMSISGPKVCLSFDGIVSGQTEYVTVQYHEH